MTSLLFTNDSSQLFTNDSSQLFTNDSGRLFTNDQHIVYQRLPPIVYPMSTWPIVYKRLLYQLLAPPCPMSIVSRTHIVGLWRTCHKAQAQDATNAFNL